jgi:hypothetical protein
MSPVFWINIYGNRWRMYVPYHALKRESVSRRNDEGVGSLPRGYHGFWLARYYTVLKAFRHCVKVMGTSLTMFEQATPFMFPLTKEENINKRTAKFNSNALTS